MKKLMVVMASLVIAASAGAEEKKHVLLEKMQPLVGTWQASMDGVTFKSTYRTGSGGSTLVEDFWPDGENMLNVIHADGGALMMTHYCAGANQPRYRATKFDGNKIDFKFVDGTNVGDDYMSGVTITLVDADHMVQEWRKTKDGRETVDMVFKFARVK